MPDAFEEQLIADKQAYAQDIAQQILEQKEQTAKSKAAIDSARAARVPDEEALRAQMEDFKTVKPPVLARPPTPPNTQEMLRPTSLQQTFGMASIMALLSVGLAKGSAIYGLKALGGFMEGAHAGNVEQAGAALKDFNSNMEAMQEANRAALAEYNAIIGNKKYTIDQQMQLYKMKALEFKDEMGAQELAQNGMKGVHDLINKRAEMNHRFTSELLRYKNIEMQMAKAGTPNTILGIPKEDIPAPIPGQINQAFLDMLTPADQQILRSMISGRMPVSGFGGLGVKQREQYLLAAPLVDPNFQAQRYGVIDKAMKEGTPGGRVGANITAINTVAEHIDQWGDAFGKLNNSQLRLWNSTKNKLSSEFGDPQLKAVQVPAKLVAAETARILRGGNASPTELEIAEWEKILDTANSPAQTRGVQWELIKGVGGRLTSLQQQQRKALNDPTYEVLTPEVKDLIYKFKPKGEIPPSWLVPGSESQMRHGIPTPPEIDAKVKENIRKFQDLGYTVARNPQSGKLAISKDGGRTWQTLE